MVVEAAVIDLAVAIEMEVVVADFEVKRDKKKEDVVAVVVAEETVIVTNAVSQVIFLEIAGKL